MELNYAEVEKLYLVALVVANACNKILNKPIKTNSYGHKTRSEEVDKMLEENL